MKAACAFLGLACSSAVALAQQPQADWLRFDRYPAVESAPASPAALDLASYRFAPRFRTVLGAGAAQGPNFAGAFTIVTWGCGSSCRFLAVLDSRSGRVFGPWMQYMVAVAFRADSRLLLVDPPDSARAMLPDLAMLDRCAVCGTPGAYVWDRDHFRAILPGPHALRPPE